MKAEQECLFSSPFLFPRSSPFLLFPGQNRRSNEGGETQCGAGGEEGCLLPWIFSLRSAKEEEEGAFSILLTRRMIPFFSSAVLSPSSTAAGDREEGFDLFLLSPFFSSFWVSYMHSDGWRHQRNAVFFFFLLLSSSRNFFLLFQARN